MKHLLILSIFIFYIAANAQTTGEVFGTVIDEKNVPVAGASVLLEKTVKGAQTDIDGVF